MFGGPIRHAAFALSGPIRRVVSARALALAVGALAVVAAWSNASAQLIVNPRIRINDSIDCSSAAEVVAEIVKPTMSDEEKAVACWRFMLDRFYHWWPPQESDGGGDVRDFAKAVNSYGFGPCYVNSVVLTALWEAAGFKTRSWTITGHAIPEVFYDGAWHMLDADARGFHRKADGQIASVEELSRDATLFTDPPGRSDPYYPFGLPTEKVKPFPYWGPPSKLMDLYLSTKDNYRYNKRAVMAHPMYLALRPGETLTLSPENDGKFYKWPNYPTSAPTSAPEEVTGRASYGKGGLTWWLEFNEPAAQDSLWSGSENVQIKDGKLVAIDASKPGLAVFRVFCPWVLMSAKYGDKGEALPPDYAPGSYGVSTDGGFSWTAGLDLSPQVAGKYEYLLRNKLGREAVEGVEFESTFQLAPLSLPQLKVGKNKVTVYRGPEEGVVQLVQAGANVGKACYVVESKGMDLGDGDAGPGDRPARLTATSGPGDRPARLTATSGPGDRPARGKSPTPARPGEPGYVVYKLTAPDALTRLSIGGSFRLDTGAEPMVAADYSFDAGKTWQQAFKLEGNDNPDNSQFEEDRVVNVGQPPGIATSGPGEQSAPKVPPSLPGRGQGEGQTAAPPKGSTVAPDFQPSPRPSPFKGEGERSALVRSQEALPLPERERATQPGVGVASGPGDRPARLTATSGPGDRPARNEALVRFTVRRGEKQPASISAIRLYGFYRLPQPHDARLDVAIAWRERSGDNWAEKEWKQTVRAGDLPQDFQLTVGGQDVKLKSITFSNRP